MTQDEIIRMAREAGFEFIEQFPEDFQKLFERFAALVAAHEREQEMKAAEKAIYVAIGLEREACAKVCEEVDNHFDYTIAARQCAAAIRARNMHSLLLIDYEALNDE